MKTTKRIRRLLLTGILTISCMLISYAQRNIALEADEILTSYVSDWEDLYAINDGYDPSGSTDKTGGAYGNWESGSNGDWDWVEYRWNDIMEISRSDVYWWTDNGGIQIPYNTYQLYWNLLDESWDTLPGVSGNGIATDQYNITTFDTLVTTRIRVYATSTIATGILEWRVWGQEGENIPVGSTCSVDMPLTKGGTSTFTLTAIDNSGSPVQDYTFKLGIELMSTVPDNTESYTVNGTDYTSSPGIIELSGTDALGVVSFDVTLPPVIDPKDGIALYAYFNNGYTQVGEYYAFQEPGLVPPDLTGDVSDNTVDNDIEISFTDDIDWRAAISGVSVNGNELNGGIDFSVSAGIITLFPSAENPALTGAGTKNILVHAAGYEDAGVQQILLTGEVNAERSEVSTLLNLYLHTTTQIQLTARDQYDNPVEGYAAAYDITVTNADATTNEAYTLGGTAVSASLADQDFPLTGADGQALLSITIPDFVDSEDGVLIQVKLADETPVSNPVSYSNDGSEKEIVLQATVNQQSDFSWERTAQSRNFIVYWGGRIVGDPTDAANGDLRFNPNNILEIMEALLSYMTDTIGFIENPDEGNMGRYKHEVVMNETWENTSVFTGYAFGGWIGDGKAGGMWIHPSATGGPAVLAHEFTHMCQAMIMSQYPGYGLNASYAGFFWESHANYMMAQYSGTYSGVQPERFINTSMLHFSTTRHYYQNAYFIDYVRDTYGLQAVNEIWRKASPVYSHPLTSLRDSVLRYTQSDLNDDFGRYAMKNVTWDYVNGPLIRSAVSSISESYIGREYTIPDSLADGSGSFVVPRHLAPGDYGYNIIPLYPDEAASEISIQFTGYANEPAGGAGNRYGFVAVDEEGNPRYSDVYSDLQTDATFTISAADSKVFLVVTGAPQKHHNYGWTTGFPKEYRYPYSFSIQGAVPAGHKAGYNSEHEGIAGDAHPNGGGFVASTATVAETVWVGPNAQVLENAVVSEDARIEGFAIIKGSATVDGSAVVRGTAIVGGTSIITENAVVEEAARVYGSSLSDNAVATGSALLYNSRLRQSAIAKDLAYLSDVSLSGTVIVGGDAEEWTNCSEGMYLQMGTVRTAGCDGEVTHRLNEDVNPDWEIYAYPIGEIPTAPMNLDALNITQSTVSLSWDAAESVNGLSKYIVVIDGNTVLSSEETSAIVGELEPETTYEVYVRAMDYQGNFSASSDTIEITTAIAGLPGLNTDHAVRIFPNPSEEVVNFVSDASEPVSVVIYESTGRAIFRTSFTGSLEVPTAQLGGEGVYYAELETIMGRYTKKLIVIP
ncbi:MAG: T9SS type A sorting domain-containing protein [Bacteroidales bacterium]|nr:T9SS type A sorting domain-containing protein [Bacteroidales bacterium]